MAVVIETTLGDITIDLFVEERPTTCMNFLKLCRIKYYNFCLFHSVQQNFITQSGDPSGTGHEGNSIFFHTQGKDNKYYEAEKIPKLKHGLIGTVSMVNCGNNMLGSQFFITLGKDLQSLDGEHCVFGEVVEGHEILRKFNEVICDQEHRPYQDIRITHTVVLEDPFDDPPGLKVPDCSPELTKEVLANSRIAPDEEIDETAGLTAREVEELQKSREAQAQATILEIVGDLPDAEIAPPENVLFVCKLNPVTTDDDLEIIFSRFGKIVSCEVIRDKATGDSLQYAFVEFENRKACEDAYFKMDNVLIDDRRIHVDFSQSVSKLRWKGKGRGVEHLDDGESSPDYGNYSRRAPGNAHSREKSRQRYVEGDNHTHQRNYRYSRDSDDRRSKSQNLQENSPKKFDNNERRQRRDYSNEKYQRSRDYGSHKRHRQDEYNDGEEKFKHNSFREDYSYRNKGHRYEAYSHKGNRKEMLQNREEKQKKRQDRSVSSSDSDRNVSGRKDKPVKKIQRKSSIDAEEEKLKQQRSKFERRDLRSASAEFNCDKPTSHKGSKHNRRKNRNDSTDTDNEKVANNRKEKVQKTKHKGNEMMSTDENVSSCKGEKHKNRNYSSDSEDEVLTVHKERHERRKVATHISGSDDGVSSQRGEKRKYRQDSADSVRAKASNSRDNREGKRREKSHSDTDQKRVSGHKNERQGRNAVKRNESVSDNERTSPKRNKITKLKNNKNKHIEKSNSKTKNKKSDLIDKKEKRKKKRKPKGKRYKSSSSSGTSDSSSSSDSDSDTSSSGTSLSSSSDSENSGDSSSSATSSSTSSSSSSSSSSNSRYDSKRRHRKKSAKISVVAKKGKKANVPTRKSKKDLKKTSDSSEEDTRKLKERGQKRKVVSTCGRNGEDTKKRLKDKLKSKKRKVSSSVDTSVSSDSSVSSDQNAKERKRRKKVTKK